MVDVDPSALRAFARAVSAANQEVKAAAMRLGPILHNRVSDGPVLRHGKRSFGGDSRFAIASAAGVTAQQAGELAAKLLGDTEIGLRTLAWYAARAAEAYERADRGGEIDIANVFDEPRPQPRRGSGMKSE